MMGIFKKDLKHIWNYNKILNEEHQELKKKVKKAIEKLDLFIDFYPWNPPDIKPAKFVSIHQVYIDFKEIKEILDKGNN